MARLLALEWDAREARLAAGHTAGREVIVEAAWSVDWHDLSEPTDAVERSARLAASLTQRGLERGDWLVAVPRGRAELRVLQTPPVPDDELPDLVRFQALRQFSSLSEDGLLDFVKLDAGQRSQSRVLAATIPPAVLAEIQARADACHATPQRIALRPFASASLFHRHAADERNRILVELLVEEADVTVVIGGQTVLVRSVRLPAQDRAASLGVQIRRTIAAAQNQFEDQAFEAMTLVGDAGQLDAMREGLSQQLNIEVDVFDPFDAVRLAPSLQSALPNHRDRYAALLGMLRDEAEGRPPAMDFLNPRRRAHDANQQVRYATFGTLALACVVLVAAMIWMHLRSYDVRLAALRQQIQELDERIEGVRQLQANVQQVDRFVEGDINWLDELYLISDRLPPPDDALVGSASFNTIPSGGGQILLEGFVRDRSLIRDMEIALRDEQRQVRGSGAQQDDRRSQHPWQFKETITVLPPDLDELVRANLDDHPQEPYPTEPADEPAEGAEATHEETPENDEA